MKAFLFYLTLMVLSMKAYGLDRSDVNGLYINKPLPTWIETSTVSPQMARQHVYRTDLYPDSVGFSDTVFWHKLTFPATGMEGDAHYYLKVSNFLIDELNFYLFHDDRLMDEWARGDRQRWHETSVYEGIWIPIALSSTEETNLLIRRSTVGTLLFPIALYDDNTIKAAKRQQNAFWVMSITALVLLLLYNVLISLATRERSFFHYVLFNVGLILSLGLILGFSRYLIPNDRLHEWVALHLLTLHTLMVWTLCRFSMDFLNLQTHYPFFWRHRFKLDSVFMCFVLISFVLPEGDMALIFLLLQILGSALCTYWAFYTKSIHSLAIRLYLFSWFILIVGALVGSYIYWNRMPYNGWTEYSFLLSSVIQLIGFSFAYSARVRKSQLDRDRINVTDSLTGLPNRQFLLTHLARTQPIVNPNCDGSIVLIRLSGHHALAQAVGPAKADIVAKQMFLNINKALMSMPEVKPINWLERSQVKLIRVSSSNCVFIMYETGVDRVLMNLAPALEQSVSIEGVEFSHPISIGVATFTEASDSLEKRFQNAQLAAEINEQSHDDWTLFSHEMQSDYKHRLNVLSLLQRDLKEAQLGFAVQPQVDLREHRILGAEVLLRWYNKELGFVSPAVFIPLAEQTGLIVKITQYIVNAVFAWVSQNPCVVEGRSVSINISAKDLTQQGFCKQVIALKEHYGITANQILLEVTETAMFDHNQVFNDNIALLKDHGFHFSIDDFGTGYSAMHNVVSLSPAEIKLDRMFVTSIDTSSINQILSDSIITLCLKTHAQSTAEGIETHDEMQTVRALRCQAGQGYYFYRPMPPDDYLALLKTQ